MFVSQLPPEAGSYLSLAFCGKAIYLHTGGLGKLSVLFVECVPACFPGLDIAVSSVNSAGVNLASYGEVRLLQKPLNMVGEPCLLQVRVYGCDKLHFLVNKISLGKVALNFCVTFRLPPLNLLRFMVFSF